MLLAADYRKRAARLFSFLALGERLSRDCARKQAKLATDKAMRRFLLMQARQEAFHNRLFESAVLYLTPRGIHRPPSLMSLTNYRDLIERALQGRMVIPDFQGFCRDIGEIFEAVRGNKEGAAADYIPQLDLRGADLDRFGVALCTVDGQRFARGDSNTHTR